MTFGTIQASPTGTDSSSNVDQSPGSRHALGAIEVFRLELNELQLKFSPLVSRLYFLALMLHNDLCRLAPKSHYTLFQSSTIRPPPQATSSTYSCTARNSVS